MLRLTLLLTMITIGVITIDIPCRKLSFFGNNIQNKAVLSPVVIVGQLGMNIPSVDEFYKITIVIKELLKGSLGEWKKKIIVAGSFTKRNTTEELCEFNADSKESRIYFLEVVSAQTGEYKVLFKTESASLENLDEINKIICKNCAEAPKLLITQKSIGSNALQLDCITESKPTPIVKWVNNDGRTDLQFIGMRNGARLQTKMVNYSENVMYICTGANILGESTTNVIIRGDILRCAINDNLLCNGHGKCYKDTMDGGKMFCRCDQGFTGSRCSNNPNKLSSDYIVRSPTVDDSFCNKNGEGYTNVITKKEYCICNKDYFGKRCSMKTSGEGRAAGSITMEMTPRDKMEIQQMLNAATSKVALHYILIGGAIVLFGCIIVIVVVISMLKCQSKKSTKQRKPNREPDLSFGSNNRRDREDRRQIENYHANRLLPPGSPDTRNVSPKPLSPNTFGSEQRENDFQQPGNGVYEGLPLPSNH